MADHGPVRGADRVADRSSHHAKDARAGRQFLRASRWAVARRAAHPPVGASPGSVAEVLGVASLVREDGGTEREAIAAVLIEALAGQVPRDELRARFGKKVARLVLAAHPDRGTVAPSRVLVDMLEWRRRADGAIDRLVLETDAGALRIRAAAVLQEARALLRDLRHHGAEAYTRCVAPPHVHLGHLHELTTVIGRRRPGSVISHQLVSTVADIDRRSELETAMLAWHVTRAGAA